jgi:hypothetical protein
MYKIIAVLIYLIASVISCKDQNEFEAIYIYNAVGEAFFLFASFRAADYLFKQIKFRLSTILAGTIAAILFTTLILLGDYIIVLLLDFNCQFLKYSRFLLVLAFIYPPLLTNKSNSEKT